jgi:hypothetical protein
MTATLEPTTAPPIMATPATVNTRPLPANVRVDPKSDGTQTVVIEAAPDGVKMVLYFGLGGPEVTNDQKAKYRQAVDAESSRRIEEGLARFKAERAALPSQVEVDRLETIADGYREKLKALADETPLIRARIIASAKSGSLGLADRKALDAAADEKRAYDDMLTLAAADLAAAKEQRAADRKLLAAKYRNAADAASEQAIAEIRQVVFELTPLWEAADRLTRTVATNRPLFDFFHRAANA